LEFEARRATFEVVETESKKTASLAGMVLKLRLDRIDKLNDGSQLVIDYKTGNASEKSWELPRPEDVQLPLYAGFAVEREKGEVGGLVFAKIRAGELAFAGCVKDARAALLPDISNAANLAKKRLDKGQLNAWREAIEKLARDFVSGKAEVDPREYPETCERCGLQAICRIQEGEVSVDGEDDGEGNDE
jgi:RecB family exonuclease